MCRRFISLDVFGGHPPEVRSPFDFTRGVFERLSLVSGEPLGECVLLVLHRVGNLVTEFRSLEGSHRLQFRLNRCCGVYRLLYVVPVACCQFTERLPRRRVDSGKGVLGTVVELAVDEQSVPIDTVSPYVSGHV
jgi:hypothetical protein